jgi:hypothetical protein
VYLPVDHFSIKTVVMLLLFLSTAIMHHIGRSLGLDCDCQDLHTCDVMVEGAGKS